MRPHSPTPRRRNSPFNNRFQSSHRAILLTALLPLTGKRRYRFLVPSLALHVAFGRRFLQPPDPQPDRHQLTDTDRAGDETSTMLTMRAAFQAASIAAARTDLPGNLSLLLTDMVEQGNI